MTLTKAQLREQQLQAALTAVSERPGSTAYAVGIHVPVPQPQHRPDILAVSAPLTLVLSLLAELEKQGKVYAVADPRGQQWHPAEGQ